MTDPPTSGRVRVRTAPDHAKADLRGRTYAIPFDTVWNAALELVSGRLPRWTLLASDDQGGRIDARVEGGLIKMTSTIRVAITLDSNAQTRVDLTSTPTWAGPDLGADRRRIRRFIRELDNATHASAATILDGRSAARRPETP